MCYSLSLALTVVLPWKKKRREIKHPKAEKLWQWWWWWGVGGVGVGSKRQTLERRSNPAEQWSTPQNLSTSKCAKLLLWTIEGNLQLEYHHRFFLHPPVSLFSDDFQHVTRHETALLSARHSDEAASFALAAHADLTKKRIQLKTFKSGKYKHTRSFTKNKLLLTQCQK